jgi:sialidase-1
MNLAPSCPTAFWLRLFPALVAFAVAGSARAEPAFEQADVFRAGEGGYALYRIPGVVVTPKGTVLVYCEARASERGDWGRTDILLRRSADGGRTWDAARKVAAPPPDARKNPVAVAQNLGKPGEITMNNPVAVVNRQAGTVHFLYCVEYARCFYTRSDDDGRTWAEPVEITSVFDQFRPEYDWKVIAAGPGHGIQLRSGRIVIPVWMSTGAGGHAHRPSCVATVYSDDDGRTWRRGEIVVNHPDLTNPSETVAVELSDGRVMLNIRHEGKPGEPGPNGTTWRAVSISPDGATNWSPVRLDKSLPEPVCMAGLARWDGPNEGSKGSILFSNPHNVTGRERKNLTVKLSEDAGTTWAFARTIEPGTAGYSDLAAGPDGTVFCFYERGASADDPARRRSLSLARFNLEWVKQGAQGK